MTAKSSKASKKTKKEHHHRSKRAANERYEQEKPHVSVNCSEFIRNGMGQHPYSRLWKEEMR